MQRALIQTSVWFLIPGSAPNQIQTGTHQSHLEIPGGACTEDLPALKSAPSPSTRSTAIWEPNFHRIGTSEFCVLASAGQSGSLPAVRNSSEGTPAGRWGASCLFPPQFIITDHVFLVLAGSQPANKDFYRTPFKEIEVLWSIAVRLHLTSTPKSSS